MPSPSDWISYPEVSTPRPSLVDRVRAELPSGAALVDVTLVRPDRAAVLARRDHPYHPFVVWTFYPYGAAGMHGGDYCATLDEAIDAYRARR